MSVSIIIATYGGEEWESLARIRALQSAIGQGCKQILPRHYPSLTIAQARNKAAEEARGDWLCFLDADDELAPGYLDAMERAYERERLGGDLLLTPAVQYVRGKRETEPHFLDRGIPLSQDNWLVVGTLIRREMFERVGGFPDYPHGFEDWGIWYKAERAGARIVKVPDATYRAHVNPRSKHKLLWRNRREQVRTHERVAAELAAWTP